MGEYVLERGRPLDGVYFLRTNGQRPWSYASYGKFNCFIFYLDTNEVRLFKHFKNNVNSFCQISSLLLDTCSPPCAKGFTCNDGECLCGSYDGVQCGGSTPSCLTSNNRSMGHDLTSKCRACTNHRFTDNSDQRSYQGSCPTAEHTCLENGRCELGGNIFPESKLFTNFVF